jgi:hypothetical protein
LKEAVAQQLQSHHRGRRHEHERHGAGAGEWAGGKQEIQHSTFAIRIFQAALNHVCLELAKMIVRDGEGVHRVVTVRVNGAKTFRMPMPPRARWRTARW